MNKMVTQIKETIGHDTTIKVGLVIALLAGVVSVCIFGVSLKKDVEQIRESLSQMLLTLSKYDERSFRNYESIMQLRADLTLINRTGTDATKTVNERVTSLTDRVQKLESNNK